MEMKRRRAPGAPPHHLQAEAEAQFGRTAMRAGPLRWWLEDEISTGRLVGPLPEPRTVERWVKKWVDAGEDGNPETPEPWEPWVGHESAEETDYLLRLDLLSRVWLSRRLNLYESQWASRIRVAVQDLDPFLQWTLARLYGAREQAKRAIGRKVAETRDLDALLAAKPWLNGRPMWDAVTGSGAFEIQPLTALAALKYLQRHESHELQQWTIDTLRGSGSGLGFEWTSLVGGALTSRSQHLDGQEAGEANGG